MRCLTVFLPLALLAALPARAGEDDRANRTFVFVYEAGIASVPDGGKQVRMWIPVPCDNHDQKIGDVKVKVTSGDASGEAAITADGTVKGMLPVKCTVAPIKHGTGRTLCIESEGRVVAAFVALFGMGLLGTITGFMASWIVGPRGAR